MQRVAFGWWAHRRRTPAPRRTSPRTTLLHSLRAQRRRHTTRARRRSPQRRASCTAHRSPTRTPSAPSECARVSHLTSTTASEWMDMTALQLSHFRICCANHTKLQTIWEWEWASPAFYLFIISCAFSNIHCSGRCFTLIIYISHTSDLQFNPNSYSLISHNLRRSYATFEICISAHIWNESWNLF